MSHFGSFVPPTPAAPRKGASSATNALLPSLNAHDTTAKHVPAACGYTQEQAPKFNCVKKLGNGAYANVWLAVDQFTGEKMAVKVVQDERNHASALAEYKVAKRLDHPHIIKTKSCFKTQTGSVMIVQEFASEGDLFTRVETGQLNEQTTRHYFSHMVRAVQHLHEINIVHRDIKPENMVITSENVGKLCDFGMSQVHGKPALHGSGTVPYICPEVLHAQGSELIANKSHDIWALGVVLYVLLTGDFPWQKAVAHDRDYLAYAEGNLTRGSWKRFSPQLIQLFSRIFVHPSKRISATELLESLQIPFFMPTALRARMETSTSEDLNSSSTRSTLSLVSTVDEEQGLRAAHVNSLNSFGERLSF